MLTAELSILFSIRGKANTTVGSVDMIAAEDRHIPKTKITQRYNSYTKSWEGNKNPALDVDPRQNPLTGGQVQTEEDLRTSEQVVNPQFISQAVLTALERLHNPDKGQNTSVGYKNPALDTDPRQYGMLSENPPAKIPASPGQSGSSGVYRTQTGRLTLDDMERILGSVYAEKQACGCSHPCQQPCTCSTSTEKGRILKGHTLAEFDTILSHTDAELRANGVSRSQILSARRLKMELESNRKQWESENEGTYVPKEFGLESLKMPEFQQSIARDCHCSNRTDKTIQCSCLVRKESS